MSFLCVVFGLFHGLAFLPVVLAMFGPDRLDVPPVDLGIISDVTQQPRPRGGVSMLGRLLKSKSQQSWDLPQRATAAAESAMPRERGRNASDTKVSIP